MAEGRVTEGSLLSKNPLHLPLRLPEPPVAAAPADDEPAPAEEQEPPGLMDRPLIDTLGAAARASAGPAWALAGRGLDAWQRLASLLPRPLRLAAAVALIWLGLKALGTIVQLAAVAFVLAVVATMWRRGML